jgi:aspartyl-tRNA(Asn)/glutamyl-tRNA(Gln) amidotransferase subunit C
MTIQRSDIEKLAELARIQISEENIAATINSLDNVLQLVDQLQAADTTGIVPMAHPLDAVQRLRPDTVTESNRREAFQAIAPATENGLYLVPRVIE